MKKYVAFFDVDLTLLNATSGKILVLQAYKNGILSTGNLLAGWFLSWLYKFRIVKSETMINTMAGWLSGVSEKKITDLISKIFSAEIKNQIRKAGIKEVVWHHNNQGQTVILSAAFSQVCAPIKEYLRMDDMISTDLEVIDGYFSGIARGKYCYKEEKLSQAIRYCEKYGFSLADAYFYSDSAEDLPLLEKVGHPVCVSPDIALTKIAQQKNWPIHIW